MNKQHIAKRLSEMLGRRVDVGLYSNIEDIMAIEIVPGPTKSETIEVEVDVAYEGGTPAVSLEDGSPIRAKQIVVTHTVKPIARLVKIDERRIDHGEQYAYVDDAGKQAFVSADMIAEATAYLEANPPEADPVFTNYEKLRERMTQDERRAIMTARRADWRVDDFVTWASSVGDRIDLMGKNVAEARAALVAAGVLTEERAEEIFAP